MKWIWICFITPRWHIYSFISFIWLIIDVELCPLSIAFSVSFHLHCSIYHRNDEFLKKLFKWINLIHVSMFFSSLLMYSEIEFAVILLLWHRFCCENSNADCVLMNNSYNLFWSNSLKWKFKFDRREINMNIVHCTYIHNIDKVNNNNRKSECIYLFQFQMMLNWKSFIPKMFSICKWTVSSKYAAASGRSGIGYRL